MVLAGDQTRRSMDWNSEFRNKPALPDGQLISTVVPRVFNIEKIVCSTDGAGPTGHARGKDCIVCKNYRKIDLKPKCKG